MNSEVEIDSPSIVSRRDGIRIESIDESENVMIPMKEHKRFLTKNLNEERDGMEWRMEGLTMKKVSVNSANLLSINNHIQNPLVPDIIPFKSQYDPTINN